MAFYDFIEIGTSDFDTELQKEDDKVGISIEPIHYYLDRLPKKDKCIQLNIGISDYNGSCTVNYLSEQTIQEYGFPEWVRGCNSINSYHTTVAKICVQRGLDIEKISNKDFVGVLTLYTLMNNLSIGGVYFLKIDTEGHDTIILKKFYEELQAVQNTLYLPHSIQFESNVLSTNESISQTIDLFISIGYEVLSMGEDTVLALNLKKLTNKTQYTQAINNYYIPSYPSNYSLSSLPHENTLDGAKKYCIEHNCTGITLQDGIYQVRDGKHLKYFKGDIQSWVYL